MKTISDLSIFESESNHRRAIAILANETIRDLRCSRSVAFKWAWSQYREWTKAKNARDAQMEAEIEANRSAFFLARREVLTEARALQRFNTLRERVGSLSRVRAKAMSASERAGGALAAGECWEIRVVVQSDAEAA